MSCLEGSLNLGCVPWESDLEQVRQQQEDTLIANNLSPSWQIWIASPGFQALHHPPSPTSFPMRFGGKGMAHESGSPRFEFWLHQELSECAQPPIHKKVIIETSLISELQ